MICPFCGDPFGRELRVANWAFVHSKVMLHLMSECRARREPCDEAVVRTTADEIADSLTGQTSSLLDERSSQAPPPSGTPTRR